MKTCRILLSVFLLAAFASHAFGAKLNPSKRNAHRSEHRRFVFQLENLEDWKSSATTSNILKTIVTSGTVQDDAPLSILKLCENTGKMQLGTDNGSVDDFFKLNQIPVPGAGWLLTSGLLGLLHKTRQRIVRRI